jgi:glycolate oxidase FAD binding subunit
VDLTAFAAEVGDAGPVTITGLGTRGGPVDGVRCVRAPSGVEWVQPDEMTVSCGAGTSVAELNDALAEHRQFAALPPGGTVGGALAVGRSGIRRLGDGPVRDTLLQARYVGADGAVVKAGGPTVKNVSGFDVCRLLVGSQGTLGFLGEVILRTRPLPMASQWFVVRAADPFALLAALYRPTSVLWDGTTTWVLLDGHPGDLEAAATAHQLQPVDGPPSLPDGGRWSLAPAQLCDLPTRSSGSFVAEVGVGIVHHTDAPPPRPVEPALAELQQRVKGSLDPTGRLNPGR